MTVTGRTPARKKRNRGSACAAVASWRRAMVVCWSGRMRARRRGRVGPAAARTKAAARPRGRETRAGAERRPPATPEEIPERRRAEDPADGGADRHAEVDREPVDGEG